MVEIVLGSLEDMSAGTRGGELGEGKGEEAKKQECQLCS